MLAYANPKHALEIVKSMEDPNALFSSSIGKTELFRDVELQLEASADDKEITEPIDQLHFSAISSENNSLALSYSFYGSDVLSGLSNLGVWSQPVLEALAPLPHTDLTSQQLVAVASDEKSIFFVFLLISFFRTSS